MRDRLNIIANSSSVQFSQTLVLVLVIVPAFDFLNLI